MRMGDPGVTCMRQGFRPLLAATLTDHEQLQLPVYGSLKIDGFRCLIDQSTAISRKLIKIPNLFVQTVLGSELLDGMDGELIVGPPNASDLFQRTGSGVTKAEGQPEFQFLVFDLFNCDPDATFEERQVMLTARMMDLPASFSRVVQLPQVLLRTLEEVRAFEQEAIQSGYEGTMYRSLRGRYKYGRSTEKEGILLKDKRFTDSEMFIEGFVEMMHNANVKETDHLGYAKRSSHKANKIPMGTLGKLVGKDVATGRPVTVGAGIARKLRDEIWRNQVKYHGKIATYKRFDVTGVKDAFRLPIFKGIRDPIDL